MLDVSAFFCYLAISVFAATRFAKMHFRRSKPRILLVAAGFKPAWRVHQCSDRWPWLEPCVDR